MYSLLAYGSLLHPDELARHALADVTCTPVRVHGFLRSFCQEPAWRPATATARAVLTVRASAGDWMNALHIHGLDADAVAQLDVRERGYFRATVPSAQIQPYDVAGGTAEGEAVLYLGREEKFNSRILPGEDYLQLCLAGAATWGPDFLRDFLRTTYVHDRVRLLAHRPDLRDRLA